MFYHDGVSNKRVRIVYLVVYVADVYLPISIEFGLSIVIRLASEPHNMTGLLFARQRNSLCDGHGLPWPSRCHFHIYKILLVLKRFFACHWSTVLSLQGLPKFLSDSQNSLEEV